MRITKEIKNKFIELIIETHGDFNGSYLSGNVNGIYHSIELLYGSVVADEILEKVREKILGFDY